MRNFAFRPELVLTYFAIFPSLGFGSFLGEMVRVKTQSHLENPPELVAQSSPPQQEAWAERVERAGDTHISLFTMGDL